MHAIAMPTVVNMSRIALCALRCEGTSTKAPTWYIPTSSPPSRHGNKNTASRWPRGKDNRGNKREVQARIKVTPRTLIGRLMGFQTGLRTFVRRWKCYNLHRGTSKWFQQQLHYTLASTSSKFKDSHITATLCNHSSPAAMDLVVPCLRYQSLSGPGWCPSQNQGVRHGSAAVLVDISASSSQKHIPIGNLQQQAKLTVSEVSIVACFKTPKGQKSGHVPSATKHHMHAVPQKS